MLMAVLDHPELTRPSYVIRVKSIGQNSITGVIVSPCPEVNSQVTIQPDQVFSFSLET